MSDVLPRPLQSQHGVVQGEALEYGNGVGNTAAHLECETARPPGGEERQDRGVADAERRHLQQ